MQTFTTEFTLTRDYLSECFDQSLPYRKKSLVKSLTPILLLAMGLFFLYFTDNPTYFGGLFIALAVLELVHNLYQRAWWITRQSWGKNANISVTITVDETGIQTKNEETKTELLWPNVLRVIETELGLILVSSTGGQQYLSKALFPTELIDEMIAQVDSGNA